MTAIVFADHDDPDIIELTKARPDGVTIFPLGLPTDSYRIDCCPSTWTVATTQASVSQADLAAADRIVFRRWRSSPPAPLAAVETGRYQHNAEAQYVQRQWESAILGLLSSMQQRRRRCWSRDPLRVDNKVQVLQVLTGIVRVPDYLVVQQFSSLPFHDVVVKPIDSDQSVGIDRRATAISLPPEDRASMQPCPMIAQRRIASNREIRACYCFGHVGAVVHVRPDADRPVDSRVAATSYSTAFSSLALSAGLRDVAEALNIRMFTADILIDEFDELWWLDINPDGLAAAFDDEHGTILATLINGITSKNF